MKSPAAATTALEKAITCICQLENMLDYVIEHTSDSDKTKDVLIITQHFAKTNVEAIVKGSRPTGS